MSGHGFILEFIFYTLHLMSFLNQRTYIFKFGRQGCHLSFKIVLPVF